ncbi:MAG TPA: glycosyltransferase [Luteitalea sp.]|nr:glycosyltransferase [Luteitalea sp.]
MTIVIVGLSITSSWGNGHATTYRSLVRGLAARGHDVLFLERDVPWYAEHRDLAAPAYCRVGLYGEVTELNSRYGGAIAAADAVIVGSYVPDGVVAAGIVLRLARGGTAFYDIDTPVTLSALARGVETYVTPAQVRAFDVYLSFTGGPVLRRLERDFGARQARALYCSVDIDAYRPVDGEPQRDLTYLGTYSADRQPTLERLLIATARQWRVGRFAVGGPQYPEDIVWPANVERFDHVPPRDHAAFYGTGRFTLNVTRQDMIASGFAPSVRLFEAAACGVPVISDAWPGLDTFFAPGREILLAGRTSDVLAHLHTSDTDRLALGSRARNRVLLSHTGLQRARELEEILAGTSPRQPRPQRIVAATEQA